MFPGEVVSGIQRIDLWDEVCRHTWCWRRDFPKARYELVVFQDTEYEEIVALVTEQVLEEVPHTIILMWLNQHIERFRRAKGL